MNTLAIKKQHGAALITALIILILLTMLGLSSMTTNVMEERMSSNSQEINRAFQAASSGLDIAYQNKSAFNLSKKKDNPSVVTVSNFGDYDAELIYRVAFREETPPKPGSGWSLSEYTLYHFSISSTSTLPSGTSVTIHAGSYQVGPK